MWIFAKTGFVSIVQHNLTTRTDTMVVRARVQEDLVNFLKAAGSKAKIDDKSGTDYGFRAMVHRSLVTRALVSLTESLDYDNFKDAVHEGGPRDHAYMSCWTAMRNFQDSMDPTVLASKKRNDRFWEKWNSNWTGESIYRLPVSVKSKRKKR